MTELPRHRSHAERIRVRQGWAQIALAVLTVVLQVVILLHIIHVI